MNNDWVSRRERETRRDGRSLNHEMNEIGRSLIAEMEQLINSIDDPEVLQEFLTLQETGETIGRNAGIRELHRDDKRYKGETIDDSYFDGETLSGNKQVKSSNAIEVEYEW